MVKAEASGALHNVIKPQSEFVEITGYSTSGMKEYLNQNALMFPVETIIEKYQEQDFDFFLSRGNFLKVTDTLEKFGANLDMAHEDAKKFVLFKKKLYQLYELRSRSSAEHTQFSTEITEEELTHVYDAHKNHLRSLVRDNYLNRLSQQKRLKGAYYKRKWLSPARVKGLSSWLLAFSMYIYHPYLFPYNSFLLAKAYWATPIAASLYGLYNLSESNVINSITRIDSGSDKGKMRISICISPLVTKDLVVDSKDIQDGGRVGSEGLIAIRLLQGYDVSKGANFTEERVYILEGEKTGNAWIDTEGMLATLQKSSDSQTDHLFADLIHTRAKRIANTKRESKDLIQELRFVVEQ